MGTIFKAFGHFIPQKLIGNSELSKRFAVSEEWIEERTGILQRCYYEHGATSDMIVEAVKRSLIERKFDLNEIDCLIVATMTPDFRCPSTAAIVQKKLGINHTFAFDIMAACSGFLYALQLADSLITSGKYKNIIVAGADKMSSVIDHNDRKTTLVLGDGSGVCIISKSEMENHVLNTFCSLDSDISDWVTIPNGGSMKPINEDIFQEQNHFLRFQNKKIFEGGIELFIKAINEILQKTNLSFNEIDLIIPHQANKRILEELAKRLDITIEKFFINVENIGNTSAASIPIALSQANEQRKLKGKILLISIGAGFTYAASLITLKI